MLADHQGDETDQRGRQQAEIIQEQSLSGYSKIEYVANCYSTFLRSIIQREGGQGNTGILYFPQTLKNSKISVIIPVHNGERHLSKCLKSIREQTYNNLQVIIVDDGSTDHTSEIYNSYSSSFFEYVIILNSKSHGVSYARNQGIDKSVGEYIAFVDSDDYIDSGYFEYLINSISSNGSDLEITAFTKEKEDGSEIPRKGDFREKYFVLDDCYDSFAAYAHRGVWGVLFRRSLFDSGQRKMRFREDISIGEDLLFYTEALSRANLVHYNGQNTPRYHYVIYETSSYHNADLIKMYSVIEAHKEVVKIMEKMSLPNAAKSAKKYLIYKYYDLYPMIKRTIGDKKTSQSIVSRYRKELLLSVPTVVNLGFGVRFLVKWLLMSTLIIPA